MKKLVSMYQKYMFRPILYKSVTRDLPLPHNIPFLIIIY